MNKAPRDRLLKRFYELRGKDFSAAGKWLGGGREPNLRERLWYALLFIKSGNREMEGLGDRLITESVFVPCHFSVVTACLLLSENHPAVSSESKGKLKDYLNSSLSGHLSDFEGVNDNFPIMAMTGALLGGQILDNQYYFNRGVERLKALTLLLNRRAALSEYNSPSYAAVSLHSIAECVNRIGDGELNQMLLRCENRVWMDVMYHFHPPTGLLAGPHSRAYMVDCVQHDTHISIPLFSVLGDQLKITPLDELFSTPEGTAEMTVHHSVRFMQLISAYLILPDYHLDTKLVDLGRKKSLPFECVMSAEAASFPEPDALPGLETVYPGGAGSISTYMDENIAVGASDIELASGVSTTGFHGLYKRGKDVTSRGDVRAIFSKYISNEKNPGKVNTYQTGRTIETQLLDEGRKKAYRDGSTVFTLYTPKPHCCKNVSSLKLSILLPCHYSVPEKIWLGESVITPGEYSEGILGESREPEPVTVRDGDIIIRITPLGLTDLGREHAVKIERNGKFILVSFYNYEGAVKDFPREAIVNVMNGFIAELVHTPVNRYEPVLRPSFSVTDTLKGIHRHTTIQRDDFSFSCVSCPVTESVINVLFSDNVVKFVNLSVSVPDRPYSSLLAHPGMRYESHEPKI